AHAALADPTLGQLLHEERSARVGLDLASTSEVTTDVRIRDWRFALDASSGTYQANIVGRELAFDLRFAPNGPVILQGEGGYSRKGPRPEQASYYYSRPQVKVSGRIERRGQAFDVRGTAWLDHEWSSEVMAPTAQGWDWIGISLHDGGAIMAFRMRDAMGASLWSAASVVALNGTKRAVAAEALRFTTKRTWKSPRTGGDYPVAMRVDVGAMSIDLVPLMDDQELDSRASVGMVYWEGAVKAIVNGIEVGRGYLELTGYLRRVRL
ncbi:MAG: lipocalin family protein, partial [Burkholderiales bacterium]